VAVQQDARLQAVAAAPDEPPAVAEVAVLVAPREVVAVAAVLPAQPEAAPQQAAAEAAPVAPLEMVEVPAAVQQEVAQAAAVQPDAVAPRAAALAALLDAVAPQGAEGAAPIGVAEPVVMAATAVQSAALAALVAAFQLVAETQPEAVMGALVAVVTLVRPLAAAKTVSAANVLPEDLAAAGHPEADYPYPADAAHSVLTAVAHSTSTVARSALTAERSAPAIAAAVAWAQVLRPARRAVDANPDDRVRLAARLAARARMPRAEWCWSAAPVRAQAESARHAGRPCGSLHAAPSRRHRRLASRPAQADERDTSRSDGVPRHQYKPARYQD
jgi:hypothetical protein